MTREEARKWLMFAEKDLRMARAGKIVGELDLAAYHLQQVVEKSLKAIIVFYNLPVKVKTFKTHNIDTLLKILKTNGIDIPDFVKNAIDLTRYAFEVRYPDDYVPVSAEEYKEAYEIAIKVYEWAKGIIEGTALE